MNNPQYSVIEEIGKVVEATGIALGKDINYQYGYVQELSETQNQWTKVKEFEEKKYPLVWLMEPFTISRGEEGIYGSVDVLRLYLIQQSNKTDKAHTRRTKTFNAVLYPIYTELLNQIYAPAAFGITDIDKVKHKLTDRYYWGEKQQEVLNDVFDCMELSFTNFKIQNNQNCIIHSNF